MVRLGTGHNPLQNQGLQMAPSRDYRGRLFTPHFVVMVILLGAAAILAGPVGRAMDLRQVKAALPLRQPLSALRSEAIRPYSVEERLTLEPAVVEALGTSDYVFWKLRDTSVPLTDPLAHPRLFVTYYTGGRHIVPHTPDQCFLGAGYEPVGTHENRNIPISKLGERFPEIPIRICTFLRTAIFNREELTVVYTFGCNGEFAETRNKVRVWTNDPRAHHAYFSKVEVHFPGASREDSVRGAAKLFNQVLPVLMSEHWPDFAAAEQAARTKDDAE